ncbi:hypothetical protein HJC23_011974 [Cyclotella cryptica]|uniref:Ankyrin repeat protein n=1 Tax=Cyclotella cryptica TaxID=29204 RepID=A0ABD3QX89_9STRA|eukprot:CCRYP_003024-RA/>CCRYP_003024-RA protein AED:0.16 eAED:0.16 QI:0/-1/0/1/-1/1/1/0/494
MGQLISSRRHHGDFSEDDTPVMGSGHCPIYDAACIGDWPKVIALCKPGAVDENLDPELKHNVVDCDARGDDTPLDDAEQIHDQDDAHDHDQEISEQDLRFRHSVRSPHHNDSPPPPLFIDAKGNTPLHIACSHHQNPPSPAISALLVLHPQASWICTHNGWLPLHLACYVGRLGVEVISQLMDGMEIERGLTLRNGGCWREEVQMAGLENVSHIENNDTQGTLNAVHCETYSSTLTKHQFSQFNSSDPLFPQDTRGRTPLHLTCSSPRDPQRRPDLIRLLLLRSNEPRKLVLTRDWIHDNQQGRTALDIIMDDYKEEIEEALMPGFSVVDAIHAWSCGGLQEDTVDVAANAQFESLYECWAIMSLLVLAAGTTGSIDRVRDVLGGRHTHGSVDRYITLLATTETSGTGGGIDINDGHDTNNSKTQLHHIFSKPCQDVIKDYHTIYTACQSLGADYSHPHFASLARKLVQGEVDKRSIGSVSELKNRWETSNLKS